MAHRRGFTLIELSIVLVIIGLLVGGVLVGRDLIKAAEVRAQLTQIEKYNQAVNTFRGKYNVLPGDLSANTASTFGFTTRNVFPSGGNENGIVEGYCCGYTIGIRQDSETMAFWIDLTKAKLIPESFNTYDPTYWGVNPGITSTNMRLYLPPTKIGNGNYVYVWSGGAGNGGDGKNYFGISVSTSIDTSGFMPSTVGLGVQQAYNMDKKVDDGLPQSGNVTAMYIAGINFYGGDWVGVAPGVAAGGTSATCYDNAGNTSNPMLYSVTQNNGTGMNCALSFKFQ